MSACQSVDNSKSSRVSRSFRLPSFVTIVVTGIGLIGAGLGIYQWYENLRSVPRLEFVVIDNQCLTRVPAVPNLDCKFTFAGGQVRNLWVSKIRLSNACHRNIIGVLGGDLMSSNVVFKVTDGYKIVQVGLEWSNLELGVSNAEEWFSLDFKKWRPNDACQLKVYCEECCENILDNGPSFSLLFDPLKEGDIAITEYQSDTVKCRALDYLPNWLSLTCLCIGIGFFCLLLLFSIWLLLFNFEWCSLYRRIKWNRKYLDKVESIINDDTNLSGNTSLCIDTLDSSFWSTWNIPPPPKNHSYVSKKKINWGEIRNDIFLLVILAVVSSISLLGLITF